ncbi:hypothetical protein THIOKS12280014 [Thiocapsa sp. KS1]|jgi:hypothetical protein|nr:hypothetical protein THIOKS12280014 [Thiocapsa sp. KS1]
MAGFKDLLKQAQAGEDSDGLRGGLADAYAGRARQLGAKGMHKEALVMWENRAALGCSRYIRSMRSVCSVWDVSLRSCRCWTTPP